MLGVYGAGKVVMKPVAEGTGVKAGGPVRAVLAMAGIRNILTKSLGSSNPINMVRATLDGLSKLENAETVAPSAARVWTKFITKGAPHESYCYSEEKRDWLQTGTYRYY